MIDFDRPITLVILNAINQSLDSGFFIAFFSHFLHRFKKYFSTLKMSHKDGLGINQIDARIHMMSGKFIIDSQKGKGTKISIVLPVFRRETLSFS